MNNENAFSILMRNVADRIASVRNHKIILDADVALLYGVETKRINEAVREQS
jgi:ORF6N domain.